MTAWAVTINYSYVILIHATTARNAQSVGARMANIHYEIYAVKPEECYAQRVEALDLLPFDNENVLAHCPELISEVFGYENVCPCKLCKDGYE